MTVRNGRAAAGAASGAAIAPGHLSRGTGLVDEHQSLGIEIGLRFEPGLPAARDIRPLLLAGVCGFLSVTPWREEAPHRALRDLNPVCLLQVPGVSGDPRSRSSASRVPMPGPTGRSSGDSDKAVDRRDGIGHVTLRSEAEPDSRAQRSVAGLAAQRGAARWQFRVAWRESRDWSQ